MKSVSTDIKNLLPDLERFKNPKTTAPHELADSVNYIGEKIGFTERYGFGYWLKRIKRKGLTYFQVKELVDTAMTLDGKYSRGGFLTNKTK